jgi:biotin carboxyl carrier protein
LIVRVSVNGRTRAVDLRLRGAAWEVTLDGGPPATVDVVRTPAGLSLLVDGRSYEVALEGGGGGTTAYVNGTAVPVRLDRAARFGRKSGAGPGDTRGPTRITAPMPGRVVKVLVEPGEVVAARQALVVVEAMKMENELRAPAPGRVVEVRVTEGTSVDANAVLVVMS